jgi:hypothetical protein
MCPVITCAAIFPTNASLMEHIAAHDSNVTLIKKRHRTIKQSSTSKITDAGDGAVILCDEDYEKLDLDVDFGLFYDDREFVNDDANGADDEENDDADEDDDNDDDVYYIGHTADGRRNKRTRRRKNSISANKTPDIDEEKSFPCPHLYCSRSFNQVN